jgi:hypothetical protein
MEIKMQMEMKMEESEMMCCTGKKEIKRILEKLSECRLE